MAGLQELDDEISNELTQAATAIEAQVTSLEAAVKAGTDTAPAIAKIKAIAQGINAAVTSPTPVPVVTDPTLLTPPAPPSGAGTVGTGDTSGTAGAGATGTTGAAPGTPTGTDPTAAGGTSGGVTGATAPGTGPGPTPSPGTTAQPF